VVVGDLACEIVLTNVGKDITFLYLCSLFILPSALIYAQTHPERVKSMVLRGIFTLRRSELLFFYQDGAGHLFPDLFEIYRSFIPEEERNDLMTAYHKRLTGEDEEVKLEAAKHWSRWENGTAKFYIDEEMLAKADDDKVRRE